MRENVVRISRRFDDEIDDALTIAQVEPPTLVLPMFDALLAGPASPMDPHPMPRHPARLSGVTLFSMVSAGYFLGVLQTLVLLRWWV